jgi:outer membrane receptor protein involved in Fe transport
MYKQVDPMLENGKRWRDRCGVGIVLLAVSALLPGQSAAPPSAPGAAVPVAGAPDLASMDIETLLNVEVTTASKFADKLSNAPGVMSVVSSDELRRFGGVTLGEILQRVPGLTVSSQYFTDRSLIAARGDQTGTTGGHILFLINGRPTREVMEGGIISDLLESFPVAALDRIEIIEGPGSVLYGSNAFAAVINLITRKAEKTEGSVEALGGAGGAVASSMSGTYQRGNLSAVGAGQIHDAPNWPVTYNVPPSEQNLSFAPHVPAAQEVNVVDRGSGGYLGLNYKDFSFMTAFTEWQSTAFVQGTVGETRMTRVFGNLGYDHKIAHNWDMSFNLTFTRTTFDEVPYPNAARESNELIAEWTNLITITSRDRLTAGALFSHIDGIELFTGSPAAVAAEGSRDSGAVYAQIDHQLLDDLKLVAGFQTNKIGNIPIDTVPRGGVIWTPSSWASVKALYGEAFRAPALDELLLNRPGVVGNPNLLPEKVGTFDLGIGFQRNRVQGGVDYFHSRQTDTIVTVGGKPAHYANLGEITFDGFEAEGKYYFRKDFFLEGSMLYQTNANGSGVTNVTPIPNLSFKGGLSYERKRGLTLSLFEVSDGAITGYTSAVNLQQGSHNVLNGHLRYDLSRYLPVGAGYGAALVVHTTNITNHAVWLPGWGFTSIDTIPVEQGRVIYAGIEFSAGGKQ